MTRLLIKSAIAAALLTTPVHADEGAIKARQALMQLNMFNAGILFGMAKGDVEYNADVASAAASNLVATANMNHMSLWPQGTDNVAMAGKTRAKPEIWESFPAIMENVQAIIVAADAMNAVAGDGVDALRGAIGGVGQACTACHKAYRGPEN